MLQSVRTDQHRADLWLGKVPDDVKGLEIMAEFFQFQDRYGKQQPVVFAAVHGRRDRVDVQFSAQVEGVPLERDLVGIDLGAQSSLPGDTLDRIRQSPGDQDAAGREDVHILQLGHDAGGEFGLQVGADHHPVFLQLWLGSVRIEPAPFPLEDLQAEEGTAKVAADAKQILALGLRAALVRKEGRISRGGHADCQTVLRGGEIQVDRRVAMLLGRRDDAAPDFPDLGEIQLGRQPESDGQQARTGEGCVQFAGHGDDGLVTQMLQREIDQVEIDTFQKEFAGGGNLRFSVRLKTTGDKRFERCSFIQARDGLDPADIGEILFCHVKYSYKSHKSSKNILYLVPNGQEQRITQTDMRRFFLSLLALSQALFFTAAAQDDPKTPADYVNPLMGNISHLLVPTFPTIHLPGGMLRVTPERYDYTQEVVEGLPVIVTSHRGSSAFTLSPSVGPEASAVERMRYDNEHIHPYSYEADLVDGRIHVRFAPAQQSAVYELSFPDKAEPSVSLQTRNGTLSRIGDGVGGTQKLTDKVSVYLYLEPDIAPHSVEPLEARRNASALRLVFPSGTRTLLLRYGVSFISVEQARKNLQREQVGFDLEGVMARARAVWNETLGKIRVQGGTEDERTVFYTSFYRILERPVCISEDGRYFSASDGQVHEDGGHPFYTDDWIWDTYRAAHPLRALLFPETEEDIIRSYLLMAEQTGEYWLPTFPEVTGDSRRMNSNHAVAMIADALYKGLSVDAEKGFEYGRKALQEKTLAPWSGKKAGWIDQFYQEHGYIPALRPGEEETDPNVHGFEKRQPVAVTLGTAYDEWCLSRIADYLGKKKEAEQFRKRSLNYRNLFNPETGFFHPKDAEGKFIEPFDYRFPGGPGARDSYDENNGWVYRWDVPHNIPDLVSLMGGPEQFVGNLDRMFEEPLGMSRRDFYALMPDHTGNVGQFSMANEPSMHIPYLYNYAGAPWKTQKRVRQMLRTWFRNDLMGVPGDEDGGGLSSFVVFSMMGFYPVTPGLPAYDLGSPVFRKVELTLPDGGTFEILAEGVSEDAKYIHEATLNGRPLTTPQFGHDAIRDGGRLILRMSDKPALGQP